MWILLPLPKAANYKEIVHPLSTTLHRNTPSSPGPLRGALAFVERMVEHEALTTVNKACDSAAEKYNSLAEFSGPTAASNEAQSQNDFVDSSIWLDSPGRMKHQTNNFPVKYRFWNLTNRNTGSRQRCLQRSCQFI